MSLIGPRPGLPDMLSLYASEEMPKQCEAWYYRIYTSILQKLDARQGEKLKDAWYAQNISFKLDIKIFIRTIMTVVKKKVCIRTMAKPIRERHKAYSLRYISWGDLLWR